MEFLLILVILVAAAPYVMGPVLVYQRQRQNPRPSFVLFDAAQHQLPQALAVAMQQNVASLERAGFATVADLFRMDRSTRTRVILLDLPAGDLGVVLGVSPVLKPERGVCTVELVARFEGDRSFTVQNTPIPGAFARVPGRDKERFRNVRDPARLYRIYQALLARRYGAMRRASPDHREDPAGFLAAAMARELRQQVDTGYFWLDSIAAAYRPTWKGAWLMCWKLLQPFRDFGEWRSDRRASALLRELNLEGDDASPVQVSPAKAPVGHWNWITIVGGLLILVVHPRFLDQGLTFLGTSSVARVRLPEGFAVPADFPGAVRALERLADANSEPLVVQDSLGKNVRTTGVVVPAEAKRAEALVAAAQDRFLARGFYLFRVAQHFGINGHPDTLAFVLTGIGFDWVSGRFTTPLADPGSLAQRFNAFCPDIVTQATGTVAALARELRRSGELYCWWD